MAKCCTGDPWDSKVKGQPDGTLTIHSEDEMTGDIEGDHHSQIRNGKCKNKHVTYETTKGSVAYLYRGKANHDCTKIEGTRSKVKPSPTDEDEVWVATKGGGGDGDDKKDKKKD